jgi:hypothetical protein
MFGDGSTRLKSALHDDCYYHFHIITEEALAFDLVVRNKWLGTIRSLELRQRKLFIRLRKITRLLRERIHILLDY